jgi:3-oxoadipate enol-lactonase
MLETTIYSSSTNARFQVLLLHAFPMSSAMWEPMATAFADLRDDAELIAIDLPGFGASPREAGWTMQDLAQELNDWRISNLSPSSKIVVCGLSMGGYAALEYYRQFPGSVRGLVLSNTRAAADTEAAKRAREIFAKDALDRGADAAIERLYGGFVRENTEPDTAVQIREWMTPASGEAIADALRAMAARQDSTDLLPLMIAPSLVIASDGDTVIPAAEMREMAMAMRDSTYVNMEGAAHLTAVERPREWAEALASFLERLV